MKNTITISGKCASGKTSLALYIKEMLEHRGFNNIVIDDLDVLYNADYPHFQEKRLSAIRENSITIKTINKRW